MKNILITILALFLVNTISAQDFQGIATYKSHRKIDLQLNDGKQNAEMQKQIQEQLRKQFQREYTLTFNKHESMYKQNEALETPSPKSSGINIRIAGGSDIMYKNIKEKRYTNKMEIYGKVFLVKDNISLKKWELIDESKNIGEYTCFKAIFKDEVTSQTINDKNKIEKVTKERTTTAWYTPQVPINNGPEDFSGLPGLILEINDGNLTLICSKLVLNAEDKIEIKEPKKGKEVSQKKFDEIMEKKNKEMMDRVQSRRGSGENVIIKVQG